MTMILVMKIRTKYFFVLTYVPQGVNMIIFHRLLKTSPDSYAWWGPRHQLSLSAIRIEEMQLAPYPGKQEDFQEP